MPFLFRLHLQELERFPKRLLSQLFFPLGEGIGKPIGFCLDALIQAGNFTFHLLELGTLLSGGEGHDRGYSVGILGLIENGIEGIIVFYAYGVIFVGMAFGTTHRQTHPDLNGGINPVLHGLSLIHI